MDGMPPETIFKLEAESSFGGTDYTTGTPQLSAGSGVRLLQHAPSYIDPPAFEESVTKSRSRSASANSRKTENGEGVWDNKRNDYVMMQPGYSSVSPSSKMAPHGIFSPPHSNTSTLHNCGNMEYNYDDSDNSVEKKTVESLSEDTEPDDASEYTQYSHLATVSGGIDVSMPVFNSDHQSSLPRLGVNAGGSSGHMRVGGGEGRGLAPTISVGEMVHNRLQAQSPTEGIKNYATYV